MPTIVSALCPLSLQTLFDMDALPIRPARLYFFQAQTQTPLTVYKDALLSIAHQQPVLTTGNGRVPPIYVGSQAYRVRIFDNFGQLIEDIDGITGAIVPTSGGGGGGGTVDPTTIFQVGDMVAAFSQALRSGWVRANGNTIGTATSGATERANADCSALFQWLWGQDTAQLLPVIGGRGTSALGDWNANKQMTLPDLRARALFGVDGMGAVNTGRLAGAVLDVGSGTNYIGAAGGRAVHNLTATEMPAHVHGASGYSDAIGRHVHTGLTGTETVAHTHQYSAPSGQANYGGGPSQAGSPAGVAATTGYENANHQHYFQTNDDGTGNHQHVLTITIASSGGGVGHEQVPPFTTATVYMKL